MKIDFIWPLDKPQSALLRAQERIVNAASALLDAHGRRCLCQICYRARFIADSMGGAKAHKNTNPDAFQVAELAALGLKPSVQVSQAS